ncbi:MAG: hypothetical protein LBH75_00695 [Treponema sp.]|nr:hypothetical protein [Treponema sp.]
MRKSVCLLLFFLYTFSFTFGQVRGPRDILLIVDMTRFDGEVQAFIVGDFLEQNVKLGDSFHLITFADAAPRLEMSARVMGNDDLERIKLTMRGLARIEADVSIDRVLAFVEKYVDGLGARQKNMTIVTSAPLPKTSLAIEAVRLGTLQPRLPVPPLQEEPFPPSLKTESQKPESRSIDIPLIIEEESLTVVPVETQPPEERQPSFAPPKIITPDDSTSPRTVRPRPAYKNNPPDSLTTPKAVLISVWAIALLIYEAAVALKCRRIRLSMNRVFTSLADNEVDGPCLLTLSVENQNTNIGRRNCHSIKPGFSLTIGGGNSDFLIFLTPLPSRLAKIHFDGEHCSFTPLKRQFFPEITSRTLPDCIGKTIRVKTKKNYDIFIHIALHESPLQKLNKLFNLVRLPGR